MFNLISATPKTLFDADLPQLYFPLLAIVVAVVGAVFGYIAVSKRKPDFVKAYLLIALGIIAIPTAVFVAYLSLYFKHQERYLITKDQQNLGFDAGSVSNLGLIIGAVIIVGIIVALAMLFGKKTDDALRTKSIVYAAVCIAVGFALSYIRLFQGPQGGTVTVVSLLPLVVYSYVFGIRKGLIAGAIYGVLQAIQDPWLIHPVQFLLDYPIAFAGIGLAGIFRDVGLFKSKPVLSVVLGAVVGGAFRYASHIVSGIFAFSSYAIYAGFDNAVLYSFVYNTYVLIDIALVIAASIPLFASKNFRMQLNAITAEIPKAETTTTGNE